MHRNRFMLILVALLLLAARGIGRAGDLPGDDDHNSAYRAVKEGHILPLITILKKERPVIGDEIVGVDFEGGDKPFYEVYFIDKAGRRREAFFDARTGESIKPKDE